MALPWPVFFFFKRKLRFHSLGRKLVHVRGATLCPLNVELPLHSFKPYSVLVGVPRARWQEVGLPKGVVFSLVTGA